MAEVTTPAPTRPGSWFVETWIPLDILIAIHEQLFSPLVIDLQRIRLLPDEYMGFLLASKRVHEEAKDDFFRYATFQIPPNVSAISARGNALIRSGNIGRLALECREYDDLKRMIRYLANHLNGQKLHDICVRHGDKSTVISNPQRPEQVYILAGFLVLGIAHARQVRLGIIPDGLGCQTSSSAFSCTITVSSSKHAKIVWYLERSVKATKDLLLKMGVLAVDGNIETCSTWPKKDARNLYFVDGSAAARQETLQSWMARERSSVLSEGLRPRF